MADSGEFAAIMGQVAKRVLPEFMPFNEGMSSSKEQRWGKKGSVSVDLEKGVWSDHEEGPGSGGGVLDLLRAYKGMETREAMEWLVDQGLIRPREEQPKEKFAGFMDRHPAAIFDYHDDKGRLAYQVLKFPKDSDGPCYMQRRPHPAGGWIWGLREDRYGKVRSGDWFKAKDGKHYAEEADLPDVRWWLYRRDEVLKAKAEGRPICLVEGEKDVETLRGWGFVATTNQGGAKNWKPELDEDLAGADVVICSDLDDAGSARTALRGAGLRGIAKSVRVIDLSLHWKDHPEKADVSDWKEKAGGTAEKFAAILKQAPLWAPQRPKSMFGGISWRDRKRPRKRLSYLVGNWLTEQGISFIGGLSGSGKSFLALHLSMCLARGQDFFNYEVRRCGVIYQAGEGGLGLLDRMDAYASYCKVDDDEDVPFELLPSPINIFSKDSKDVDNLIAEIKALSLCMSVAPGLLVIDTLRKATPGADEISGKDNGVILDNVERIRRECGIAVMLVHHLNADGKKLRGHTSLRDDVDQVILIEHDKETGDRTAILNKIKDGQDGLKVRFTLASVPVARDDGEEVSSCVVLTVSEKERLKKEQARQGAYVNATERRVLMNLFDTVDRHGKFVASEKDGPKEAIGKIVVTWKDYLAVAHEKMIEEPDKVKATERIRKEFTRAKDSLLKYGIIGVDTTHMWWTGKPVRGFPRTFPRKDQADLLDNQPASPGMQEIYDMQDRGDEVVW